MRLLSSLTAARLRLASLGIDPGGYSRFPKTLFLNCVISPFSLLVIFLQCGNEISKLSSLVSPPLSISDLNRYQHDLDPLLSPLVHKHMYVASLTGVIDRCHFRKYLRSQRRPSAPFAVLRKRGHHGRFGEVWHRWQRRDCRRQNTCGTSGEIRMLRE